MIVDLILLVLGGIIAVTWGSINRLASSPSPRPR
jgi:hypothetical protein